ncbi:MAG TPA: cobalamin-binding protein [Nitrosopumilaceae archaeon]|nr:cobalamin-binding protein [Nitrosopumilaceae archaeon]
MPNRIVSFLPSATEILYELGVGDQIVGVTHECNYPEQAKSKPRVIHSSFDPNTMTSQEIDNKVVDSMHSGKDIYILDEQTLKNANPNLIISQGICEVCSPYTKEVNRAVTILHNKPEVIILDPHNLENILDNIITIGNKVGKTKEAEKLVLELQKRIQYVNRRSIEPPKKVLCIEWLDPLFTAGHWVPQMVEMVCGINGLASGGDPSRRMKIDEAIEYEPDVIVLMPCGFDIKRTILEYEKLANNPQWKSLAAVQNGQVYAVNANEYFSKPGPRTVTGLEILAKIIHPKTYADLTIPDDSFQKINTKN